MKLEALDCLDSDLEMVDSCFESTMLVGVQHLLETTGSLIEKLINKGFPSEQILLSGKHYSSNIDVINKLEGLGIYINGGFLNPELIDDFSAQITQDIDQLWMRVLDILAFNSRIKNIIILDDGARCISTIPVFISQNYSVVSIEQTTSGIARLNKLSITQAVISVADSKSKLELETPFIIEKALDILNNKFKLKPSITFGIVGVGNIGATLLDRLNESGYLKILTCDKKYYHNNNEFLMDLEQIFQSSDIIFGCTGKDISKSINVETLKGTKVFVSLSSEDVEFFSIKRVLYQKKGIKNELHLLNNGFPINFDGSKHSVDPIKISLTRGLLLSGLIQAASLIKNRTYCNEIIPLDGMLEQKIRRVWKQLTSR